MSPICRRRAHSRRRDSRFMTKLLRHIDDHELGKSHHPYSPLLNYLCFRPSFFLPAFDSAGARLRAVFVLSAMNCTGILAGINSSGC